MAVCGGLASDPDAVPLLLGLGVTELSVVPGADSARSRRVIRTLDAGSLPRARASARSQLGTAAEVRALVKEVLS